MYKIDLQFTTSILPKHIILPNTIPITTEQNSQQKPTASHHQNFNRFIQTNQRNVSNYILEKSSRPTN